MDSLKSFAEIKCVSIFWENEKFTLAKFFPTHGHYFAHTPHISNPDIAKESLEEHISLVCDYFFKLVAVHSLEDVVDRLIASSVPFNYKNRTEIANFIKTSFLYAIVYHDFGKINRKFQIERMGNNSSIFFDKDINHNFKHHHSALGAYIFGIHQLSENLLKKLEVNKQNNEIYFTIFVTMQFMYSIIKHHSKVIVSAAEDSNANMDLFSNADFFKKYLPQFKKEIDNDRLEILHDIYIKDYANSIKFIFDGDNVRKGLKYEKEENLHSFPFKALLNLNYSLLTASDYLATNEYYNQLKLGCNDFGVLSKNRIDEITMSSKSTPERT